MFTLVIKFDIFGEEKILTKIKKFVLRLKHRSFCANFLYLQVRNLMGVRFKRVLLQIWDEGLSQLTGGNFCHLKLHTPLGCKGKNHPEIQKLLHTPLGCKGKKRIICTGAHYGQRKSLQNSFGHILSQEIENILSQEIFKNLCYSNKFKQHTDARD